MTDISCKRQLQLAHNNISFIGTSIERLRKTHHRSNYPKNIKIQNENTYKQTMRYDEEKDDMQIFQNNFKEKENHFY